MNRLDRAAAVSVLAAAMIAAPLAAQWTNRYPKIQGMSHHVYLEGYELPSLTIGPIDPSVSPDGRQIAFASRGWLWLLDRATHTARRITSGAGIDARPSWSPDGQRLAFVRDNTIETSLVELDVSTGTERLLVDEPAIDLDPVFSPDGKALYYSSARAGDLDIWRLDLASGAKSRITDAQGSQELQPLPLPDGRLVYIAKGSGNEVRIRDTSGTERTLASGPILSMLRIAASPDGQTLALTWPTSNTTGWQLQLIPVDGSPFPIHLTGGHGLPLTPTWTPDGRDVLYVEADLQQRMRLYRMPAAGGTPTEVAVAGWDWDAPTGRVRIETRLAGDDGTVPARIAVTDATGHPLVPDQGQPRFDGQNGVVFFYTTGAIELTVPLGAITATAVQGLATPAVTTQIEVTGAATATGTIVLAPVWDPRAAGWLAGDHHFHLNYGGPYQLPPTVLGPMARAEGMDVLTPLLANLHTRFEDQALFGWRDLTAGPLIAWGQEVRSHFLGHLGLIGTAELFWPWIWGPGYELHGRDDRANAEVLAFSRRQGGVSSYVHPIAAGEPFSPAGLVRNPVELVADGVLGLFDTIELVCLWSDEIGSMDMWYRLLNFGIPIAVSAGTDVMNNFYRTMAIGTTRVYVRSDSSLGYRGYLEALRAGRSFATNGPMLDFTVDSAGPGNVLRRGSREAPFVLTVHTAVPVDSVEVVVNGAVVARLGPVAAGSKRFDGRVRLPTGGWVAARALGGKTTAWPAMDSYAFGHTSPIWIATRGSTTVPTKQAAARDLATALDASMIRLRQGYQGSQIPKLEAHFARARAELDRVR